MAVWQNVYVSHRLWIRLAAILTLTILLGSFAEAQAVKSAFVGTIRDSSGAVIPGATITVRNIETNVTVTATANADGAYYQPFLNSGTYSLTAERPGFKTSVVPSIKLDVDAQVRVDFTLQVGAVTERVVVSSTAPLLETDTSSVGLVFASKKMTQLPLLGRDYQALAQLAPTAVAPTTNLVSSLIVGLSVGNYFQVSGQRGAAIHYTIDGIDANNVLYQWQSIIPPLDTIQEFKVLTHDFSAEYGRGTVQFTTITKAGTNQFHGSAYEYNQNNAYNATPFFTKRAGVKLPPFNENQFGATLGGPVWIPKIYDGRSRTFFFAGYQGTRFRQSSLATGRFPDPAWLTGDFSNLGQPIYDPLTTRPNGKGGFTRDPFPGNKIPSSRFSPNALADVPFLPKPNAAPGTLPGLDNTDATVTNRSHVNFWTVRIDQNISSHDRLTGRYMQSVENYSAPSLAPLSGITTFNKGYNAMIEEAHTFSARMFNEARIGYNRGNYESLQDGAFGGVNYPTSVFKFKNVGGGPITWGLPAFTFANFSGNGAPVDHPIQSLVDELQFDDNLVITRGHHVLKMGFDFRPERFYDISGTGNRGSFDFNGQFTQQPGVTASGSPFADLLLGYSDQALGLAGEASGTFHQNTYGVYFQDDWRVTHRLTFNLGLRYERYGPWTEKQGRNSRFIFGAPIGSCFANTTPCPPGTIFQPKPGQPIYTVDDDNFAPRIGLAYSLGTTRPTVVRAAYGIFYTPLEANEEEDNLNNPPNTFRFTLLPTDPYTDLSSTQLSNLFPNIGFASGTVLKTGPTWTLPRLQIFTPVLPWHTATVNQWQLTIQHELFHNLMVEAGYLGSNGYHFQRVFNGNQAILDQPGHQTSVLSRTPYPQLAAFMRAISHNSINNYNAGTLRVERRFEKGLSLLASYTYAKTIDDYGNSNDFTDFLAQNAYDLKADRGLSGFDARHRLTVGYVWEIPVGRGRSFGSHMNRVLDGFIGGWQVNGITTMQSGHPLRVVVTRDWSNTGQLAAGIRPNQSAPVRYMNPHNNNLQWFNPSAFSNPPLGSFGDAHRGALHGPGFDNWDITLAKTFPLHESAHLQFRGEFYNAFNHTQFDGVNSTVGSPSEGFVNTTLAPRDVQLAVRLEF